MLIILKLSSPASNLFIILKIKLSKVIFPFKVALIIIVNIFLPITYTNTIKLKGSQPVYNN